MKRGDGLVLDPGRAGILHDAFVALERVRVAHPNPEHRSRRRLQFRASTLTDMVLVVVVLCGALFLARPWLMEAWHSVILWWASQLGVPVATVLSRGVDGSRWLALDVGSPLPTAITGLVTAAVCIVAYAASFWMSDRQVPLKYLVRILCIVQATALLFFVVWPSRFPYNVPGHINAMLNIGFYLMLALPVLLALGYAVLRLPLHKKLLHPALMLGYFALMLPHKAVLHILILINFSTLFMPLLYFCFGVVFDLMVFVALYSWLVSRVPVEALD